MEPTVHTVGGGIRTSAILLLLLLLALLCLKLLLRELSLLLIRLLALDSGEKVVGLEVLGVVMADALLLHLPKLLQRR